MAENITTTSVRNYQIVDVIVSLVKNPIGDYELRCNLGNSLLAVMDQKQFDHFLECMHKLKELDFHEYIFPCSKTALYK